MEAAGNMPKELLTTLITKAAEKFSGTEGGGILQSILKDPSTITAIINDPQARQGFDKLVNGDWRGGLADISTSRAVGNAIGTLLLGPNGPPKVKEFLANM